ncbi:MAG: translation initiation factor IF-3 [Saprospiraceae bacterium]|nr:translation initiation factor IF-3 [Saprospiraceae bacterium]
MRRGRRKPPRQEPKYFFRTNHQIKVPEVRLTGDNVENGVYSTSKAMEMAEEQGLDLVEIAAKARPPVCQIVDYKKFLYEKKKRDKELKSKQQKVVVKEIRFTPNTDDHDIDFKLKHAEKFLKEGAKVKAFVHFRGRSIVFKDRGELLLLQFAERLQELGDLEAMPKLEGKRMSIFIMPKKKK